MKNQDRIVIGEESAEQAGQYEQILMEDDCLPIRFLHFQGWRKGEEIACHWHEHYELLYLKKGRLAFSCNHSGWEAKAGQTAVFNSNELHAGRVLEDGTELYGLIVDQRLLKTTQPSGNLVFQNQIPEEPQVRECFETIFQEWEKEATWREFAVKCGFYELATFLMKKELAVIVPDSDYLINQKNRKRVNRAVRYLREHYQETVTTRQVAESLHLSVSYFCRLFKEGTGQPMADYLNDLRIDKAQALLKNNDLTVAEAAGLTGFDDVSYFARIYKKKKGIAPSSEKGK